MNTVSTKNRFILMTLSILSIGFGILTIISGAFALFGGEAGGKFAGNYVSFVLWFNFIAGFFYVAAGTGIYCRKKWAVFIAKSLALSTLIVFFAFGIVVVFGEQFEMRTIGAMTLRSVFWVLGFIFAKKHIN